MVHWRIRHEGLLMLSSCKTRRGNEGLPGNRLRQVSEAKETGPRWSPVGSCHRLSRAESLPFACICQRKRQNPSPPTCWLPSPPPTHSFQTPSYFMVLLFIGGELWNSCSPHQKQPTSCCTGTCFSAWSRCHCLKIPNKTLLATIKSRAFKALYNFQSKWH